MLNLLLLTLSVLPNAVQTTVEVFYKEMPPSLQTLEEVNKILSNLDGNYLTTYHLITDTASANIIQNYNLPGTHFPFAVAINGKYSAMINGETIYFVHFPMFMHGIGRHEGNWSMEHLQQVLSDTTLLINENTLPILDESAETTECKEEE